MTKNRRWGIFLIDLYICMSRQIISRILSCRAVSCCMYLSIRCLYYAFSQLLAIAFLPAKEGLKKWLFNACRGGGRLSRRGPKSRGPGPGWDIKGGGQFCPYLLDASLPLRGRARRQAIAWSHGSCLPFQKRVAAIIAEHPDPQGMRGREKLMTFSLSVDYDALAMLRPHKPPQLLRKMTSSTHGRLGAIFTT